MTDHDQAVPQRARVSLKPMQLSDDRVEYFVSIQVGDREVTPHVFRDEYKSAYHVALYDWLLNGVGEEPDCVEFGPHDWPARKIPPVDPTNHHNALACPYCNPEGLKLTPAASVETTVDEIAARSPGVPKHTIRKLLAASQEDDAPQPSCGQNSANAEPAFIPETCPDCGVREPCDDDCPNHIEPELPSPADSTNLDDLMDYLHDHDSLNTRMLAKAFLQDFEMRRKTTALTSTERS